MRNFIIMWKYSGSQCDWLHILKTTKRYAYQVQTKTSTEIAQIFHNWMLSYCMYVRRYCILNSQILANGYSFVNCSSKSVSQAAILNLTSWFSRSGSCPRHIHWKGTQWNSTIVKHTQTQTGLCLWGQVPKSLLRPVKATWFLKWTNLIFPVHLKKAKSLDKNTLQYIRVFMFLSTWCCC